MKIKEVITFAKNKCLEANVEDISLYLMQEILEITYAKLLIQINDELDEIICNKYIKYINRYCNKEAPIQYLLGYAYFMKRKFIVNNNVLIPRFETEELIHLALREIEINNYKEVLDLCTGSGCIAITLKKENPLLNIIASDISLKALNVANDNAKKNNVKVTFIHSDLFEKIECKFDLIVCNPPYIALNDLQIDEMVKLHEPSLALYGGKNGLDYYCRIIDEVINYLKPNGQIIFEIGCQQKEMLENYLNKKNLSNYRFYKDINGKQRILCIKPN